MYADLVRATPGLSAADIPKYFKDESFGVKPEDVVRTYSPRDDVTIQRDTLRRPAHLRRHDPRARCSGSATPRPRTGSS